MFLRAMTVMIMSRQRRRIYVLLALLPTTLGVATYAVLDGGRAQEEGLQPAAAVQEAVPDVAQEAQSIGTPAANPAGDVSGANPDAEATEVGPAAPAQNARPVQDAADDAAGPAQFADSGPTESAGASSGSERPIRIASIGGGASYSGGGAGGGRSRNPGGNNPGGNKEPQANPSVPPGDSTSPDNGKEQPSDSQGGNSPGTNVPGDEGKQGEGPSQGGPNEGGPNQGGPNTGGPKPQGPGDEGGPGDDGDDDVPYIPPVLEKPVEVPEPATLGLLALGLLGCATRRKARK
jgi:translation initiation factor IF-2